MAFNLGQILGAAGSAGAVGFDQSYDAVRRRHLEDLELQGQNILAGALMPGATPMPGPIGGLPPPQPPPPGQQSMPRRPPQAPQPPVQGPPGPPQEAGSVFGGLPGWAPGERPIEMGAAPQGQMPPIQPSPSGPPGGGAPAPMGGAPPQGAGMPQPGMPQLDLPVLLQRIQERYPHAPPAAVMSAVQRAIPLLSMEGKREALLMRQQYLAQSLSERSSHNAEMEARNRALDELREKLANQREAGQNARLDTREAGRNARVSPDVAAFQTYMEQNPNATAEDMAKFRQTLRAQGGAAGAPAGRTPTGVAVAKFMQENPDATSDQIMEFAHKHDKQSATVIKLGEKAKGYDNAHQIIDDALNDIKKSYQGGISVTGLAGRGLRIGEIAANIAGWSDSTLANSFQQKVELLKTTLPRLLTGASITNKDERARMDKIVAGLSAGDTRQITVDDMLYLQKVLKNLRPSDYDRTGKPAGGAAAPQGPAPGTVKDGYRFKGGDPSKQESWEPVGDKRSSLDEGRVVSDADTRPQGGQQYAMMDDPRARRGADRFGQLPSGGGGASGGGVSSKPTSQISEVYQKDAQILENHVSAWAQGRMTGKELKARFNKMGWDVDLRRGRYDVEAFDPSGKSHYLTP